MKVMLISGHGAGDPGAVGCGYQEATETRRMATAVKPKLEAHGINVQMYDQSKNAYSELLQGNALPIFGIDYVIEFHLNAGVGDTRGNGATTGTEILVDVSEGGTSVEECILKKICALGFKNRGVKRRNDLLVQNTVTNFGVSHALIETCFIDDRDDMQLYAKKFNQIAQAIADGVAEGFGIATDINVGTIEEADEMTEAEVKKIIADEESKKTYDSVSELPFGKETVQKLIDKGLLSGVDSKGNLGLSYDLLRILVINDRAGVYGE